MSAHNFSGSGVVPRLKYSRAVEGVPSITAVGDAVYRAALTVAKCAKARVQHARLRFEQHASSHADGAG